MCESNRELGISTLTSSVELQLKAISDIDVSESDALDLQAEEPVEAQGDPREAPAAAAEDSSSDLDALDLQPNAPADLDMESYSSSDGHALDLQLGEAGAWDLWDPGWPADQAVVNEEDQLPEEVASFNSLAVVWNDLVKSGILLN